MLGDEKSVRYAFLNRLGFFSTSLIFSCFTVTIAVTLTIFLLLSSCALTKQGYEQLKEGQSTKPSVCIDETGNEYYPNRVLIGYSDVRKISQILNLLNGRLLLHIPEISVISVEITEDAKKAIQLLETEGIKNKYGIRYAEYVYVRKLVPFEIGPLQEVNRALVASKVSSYYSNYTGESLDLYLWGLRAIKVKDGWKAGYDGEGVIVAVLDTGVDGTHPDLEGQLVEGYRPLNDEIFPAGSDSSFGGAHGTHVAGTIAAKLDGKGIVGVAPRAKIMPVVLFDNGGWYVGDDYAAKGIVWAVNHGAKVLSNSWGGSGYSQTLKEAFDYALERGVVVVAAAGNSKSIQSYQYPANYPGVIQVGAVEFNGGNYIIADFSSGSPMISVCAPGVSIISTMPQKDSYGHEAKQSFAIPENGGYYGFMTGTSMATPHVSGLVALLLQKYPIAKPWQIRKMLEQNALDIETTGYDEKAGYGLIQANSVEDDLPSSGGLDYQLTVTDAYSSWRVPSVSVSLLGISSTGRNVRYFAKTNTEGIAKFIGIDSGRYDVIVSGPDTEENSNGLTRVAFRKAEERTVIFQADLVDNRNNAVRFSSSASLRLVNPPPAVVNSQIVFVDVTKLPTETGYEIAMNLEENFVDFSELSGRYLIKLRLPQKADTDILLSGTLTLNGVEIPVNGKITKNSTETYLSDDNGSYTWWTLFGKAE